jgi:lipopolysaccharide biosynthesis regulator YciM
MTLIFVPRYLDRMVLGLEQKEAHIQKIEDVLEQQRSKKEELVEGLRQGYANLKDMIAKTKELQKQVRPTTGDLLVSGLY